MPAVPAPPPPDGIGGITVPSSVHIQNQWSRLFGQVGTLSGVTCTSNPQCKDCANPSPTSYATAGSPVVINGNSYSIVAEESMWNLPPGAIVGGSWCVTNPICCSGVGLGSSCCPSDGIPAILAISIQPVTPTGSCGCLGKSTYLIWDDVSSTWKTAWTATCGTETRSLSFTMSCGTDGHLTLSLTCNGKTSKTNVVPGSCKPFTADALIPWSDAGVCCSGATSLDVHIADNSGSTGAGTLNLTVRYTEIFLPTYVSEDTICVQDPVDCCNPATCGHGGILAADCMSFEVSGVTRDAPFPCDLGYWDYICLNEVNGTYCLRRQTESPFGWTVWNLQDNQVFDSAVEAVLIYKGNGEATLDITVGDTGGPCGGVFHYRSFAFNCLTGGRFLLISLSQQPCRGFPDSILVSPGTCCCNCDDGAQGWLLSLDGITGGFCTECNLLNGTSVCLNNFDAPSCGHYRGINTLGFQSVCPNSLVFNIGYSADLWIDPKNCHANLAIGILFQHDAEIAEGDVVYESSSWSQLAASNTLTKTRDFSGCGFPAQITLTRSFVDYSSNPSGDCSGSDPGSSSHDCHHCSANNFLVSMSGWSNSTCIDCNNLNSVFEIGNVGDGCDFISGPGTGFVSCGGSVGSVVINLSDNGATGWELTVAATGMGTALYFLAYAAWSCDGLNVMQLISAPTGCNAPSTIQVQKVS